MKTNIYPRIGTIAAALAMTLTTASAPAGAPVQAAGPAKVVRAICCKCVDGSQQSVSVDTRTAPWTVALGTGSAQAVTNVGNPAWGAAAPAGWVGPAQAGTGTYRYKLTIVVPRCVIGGRVTLKGRFGADNSGKLLLDGNPIASTSGGNLGFQAPNFGSFSVPVNSGNHTLEVVVSNPHGPTGMILQGALVTDCPRSPELGGPVKDGDQAAAACKCDADKASV